MSEVETITAEKAIELLYHDGDIIFEDEAEELVEHTNAYKTKIPNTVPQQYLFIAN